jgi:hypothetical protein
MINDLLLANMVFLLLCASMYLGTGWSLVLFSFPIADQLTVSSYGLQFNQQVALATRFFTYMTTAMLVSAAIMVAGDFRSSYVALPIVVLASVTAATVLTVVKILPLNRVMAQGITDAEVLRATLQEWMKLNWVRVALWTVQWLCVALALALPLR